MPWTNKHSPGVVITCIHSLAAWALFKVLLHWPWMLPWAAWRAIIIMLLTSKHNLLLTCFNPTHKKKHNLPLQLFNTWGESSSPPVGNTARYFLCFRQFEVTFSQCHNSVWIWVKWTCCRFLLMISVLSGPNVPVPHSPLVQISCLQPKL